jgi:hypothetical protein
MASAKPISLETRKFFDLLNQAAFANPFGATREAIDLQLVGLPSPKTEAERTKKTLEVVFSRMRQFEKEYRVDIRQYRGQDRILVQNALLFYFFHLHLEDFDQFILNQISAGDTPLTVPFARKAFQWLLQRGFEQPEICRYFELVFQLRRAFFLSTQVWLGAALA